MRALGSPLLAGLFVLLGFTAAAEAQGRRGRADDVAITDDAARVRIEVEGAMAHLGPDDALVTLVVWSDFQCPFCARLAPTLTALRERYGDDLRIVFRDNPLPFHANAVPAAEAAREALAQRGQRGFWQMHDLLFENHDALERADLERYAAAAGLDLARFRRALDAHTHRAAIEADAAVAASVGASGTPTSFINGRLLVGAVPIESFAEIIDDELVRARRAITERRASRANYYARLMRGAPVSPPPAPAAAAPRRDVPDPEAVYRVPVAGAPSRGGADALVTIVVFSDFQCPFCARVVPTLERLVAAYGTDLRIVFRNNPLPFHENASAAAEAALEAYAQRGDAGFWAMHDVLFAHQREPDPSAAEGRGGTILLDGPTRLGLTRADLERHAAAVGLDVPRFRRALDAHTHLPAITADGALATSLGARGTPSFFINGRLVRGAQPYEVFVTAVDRGLAEARAAVAAGTPRGSVYDTLTARGATAPVLLPSLPAEEDEEDEDRIYDLPLPARAPSRGGADAAVVIQIFSDFQCPFCARAVPTVDALVERYGDRVRFVWRNYPLPFHDHAMEAAEAAMEAFAQRGDAGFWAMHDLLFDNQRELTRTSLETYAFDIGLDGVRFRRALDTHVHRASIEADMAAVRASGAEIGTPSFFIEGRLLQGAQPLSVFVEAIDAALARD
jgi:protein-disulfide isomerase